VQNSHGKEVDHVQAFKGSDGSLVIHLPGPRLHNGFTADRTIHVVQEKIMQGMWPLPIVF